MIMIDKMAYSSGLRYISPCLKAFLAVATLFICVAARSVIISIVTLAVMGSLTVIKGGTSLSRYIRMYRIPLFFLVLSTVTIAVNITDEALTEMAVPMFHKYLNFSWDTFYTAANLVITALGAVSCLYFLSLTTPVTDLLYVLNILHCPGILAELLLLVYRFLFVLYDMAAAISVSQKSRLGNKDFKTSLHSMSGLLVMLLIRAIKKSSFLYDAMESRCYDGKILVLNEAARATKREVFMAAAFEAFMIGIWLMQRSII